ncbi:MAG: hypothetical protein WAR76_25205 [Xanthobacteraceae bacterium]
MVKAGFKRGAMIAPTASDARDVMVEGSSGLLATAWKYDKDHRANPLRARSRFTGATAGEE